MLDDMFKDTNREGSRKCKNDEQLNVLDEQEKADLDAEKDIRELSDALCPVSFNMMPDEVQNDWNSGQQNP